MSVPEKKHDHINTSKLLVLPSLKKAILAICMIASISSIFYLVSRSRPRCRECHNTFRNAGIQRYVDTDTINSHLGNEQTNISHIMFGIAGSTKTWNKRRPLCELWWKPNITRGFVWLDEKPLENETWSKSSPPYQVSEDTSRFNYTCWYGAPYAVRIARIVKESFQLGLDNVRWFVMGDDDTFFFTENLVTVLEKYDHNEMYYIGDNSESVEQDEIFSYSVAYGGGGFAISYPLAVELVRVLDGCINRYASMYGSDQKIQACMSEIGIPLTKELGFHQLDILGNPYGFLAAHPVAPLVSLHHLSYLRPIFPGLTRIDSLKKLVSAYKMDPGRALQQSFCYDLNRNWSVSVAWGYSVQLYPSLVTAKLLETPFLTFQTWRTSSNKSFTFNTRPMSPDPCERPVVYFLDRVERVGKNQTLASYKMFVAEEGECEEVEYGPVVAVQAFDVFSSTLEADFWKKAPRRQCCEVINDSNEINKVEIHIRGCNKWETITLP